MFRNILSVSLMFPFSNKYLVDSGTYLKKNEQETSVLIDFEHSNLCSFDKKAFLANIQIFYLFRFWQLLGEWHFWMFHGVAENIVSSLLFCNVIIDHCLLNKTFVFHFPTDEALQFL